MDLYFAPLACSMATRITLYEIGVSATYLQVDTKAGRVLNDDSDFLAINPLGLVPALRTDDGFILTENAAILQYVAERFPEAGLGAAAPGVERARLQQWLCFIGTELHKALFSPLLDPKAPAETKAYVPTKGKARLDLLDKHLTGREFLLDRFTVADAYLTTVLNWTVATPTLRMADWPVVQGYLDRMRARPSIAKALSEEVALYKAEQARHAAKAA